VKREAATLHEDRGLSRNTALKAQDLIAKTEMRHSRDMANLLQKFDFKFKVLQNSLDSLNNDMEGLNKYVFANPSLFDDHEGSYSTNHIYKMWYDSTLKKQALVKKTEDLIEKQEQAIAALEMKQQQQQQEQLNDSAMPPPAKRAKQTTAEDVSSTLASTTSKVPVKEVTTEPSNRPDSRLSAVHNSLGDNEEQVSTDDQLDPEMEIDLNKDDKDETGATPVVSEYVLLNYVIGSGLSSLAFTGQLISCFLNAISK
jgi:hypothetical protein